jgi:hypothetical protein
MRETKTTDIYLEFEKRQVNVQGFYRWNFLLAPTFETI